MEALLYISGRYIKTESLCLYAKFSILHLSDGDKNVRSESAEAAGNALRSALV